MLDGSYWFECSCYDDEHTIRFTLDKEYKEIYTSVYLGTHLNFFQRVWLAVRYTFGYKSKHGAFGNWILREEDIVKLSKMLKSLNNE